MCPWSPFYSIKEPEITLLPAAYLLFFGYRPERFAKLQMTVAAWLGPAEATLSQQDYPVDPQVDEPYQMPLL